MPVTNERVVLSKRTRRTSSVAPGMRNEAEARSSSMANRIWDCESSPLYVV